jgi:hypothetical protein
MFPLAHASSTEQARDARTACRTADAAEVRRILTAGRLAYVAVTTARGPLVTPVLYGVSGGSLWFVANRHTLKVRMFRRDPRTAWVVRGEGRSVAMTGEARLLSTVSARDAVAALPGAFRLPGAVGTWAARNPRQVVGYARDVLTSPQRGMPQDFVLVELRPRTVRVVDDLAGPRLHDAAQSIAHRLDGVAPAELAVLVEQPSGVLGLTTPEGPLVLPVGWDPASATVELPSGLGELTGGPACVTFDEPVHDRPTEQRGIMLRGSATGAGDGLTLSLDRVTWWDGFETSTGALG